MFSLLFDFLKEKDFKYKERVNLKILSSVGIGPTVPLLVYPSSTEQLVSLVEYLHKFEIQYKIVGRMTNILFTDKACDFVIIATADISRIEFSSEGVYAECGATLRRLCALCVEQALCGIEALSGIPASVGGAILSNAGAYGAEVSDVLETVRALDKVSGQLIKLCADECDFSYRHSIFQTGRYVILSAKFRLSKANFDVGERMREFSRRRIDTQPTAERSLGSTFKRPRGAYAAELIDRCGLKGTGVGGVKISEKHAGFIVNTAHGTAEDYVSLMELVRRRVYDEFSLLLEPEIEIF
ncbi:MAG: UDP-N-acetylmuramate dehydrogenase [Clostridia bacterium]|nr:UDP-N-acetylmuramate dehydrogenase [Clostridia bacterium]